MALQPPYKQQVLHYLVLQAVFSRGILKKFQRVVHFLGLKVRGTAATERQTEAVTQRVSGWLGELNSPQTMPIQVPIRVYDLLL